MFFAGRDLVSPQRSPGITRLQYLSLKNTNPRTYRQTGQKCPCTTRAMFGWVLRLSAVATRCGLKTFAFRLEVDNDSLAATHLGAARRIPKEGLQKIADAPDAVKVLNLAHRLCRSNSAIDRPTAHLGQGLCRLRGSPEAAQLWRWHP